MKRFLQASNPFKIMEQQTDPSPRKLFISTSKKEQASSTGTENEWRDREALGLEEFADVVWMCVSQSRRLRTMTMSTDFLEGLRRTEMKSFGDRKQELIHREVSRVLNRTGW